MGAKNTVEVNIVDLEVIKKLAGLYKKDNPDWEEKVFGKPSIKTENAFRKAQNETKEKIEKNKE